MLLHSYSGSAVEAYQGPTYSASSIYVLRLRSTERDTLVDVYLHEGPGPSGAFPELPPDPRVHALGVGMTSVTLSWTPSPSVKSSQWSRKQGYEYCVTANRKHNFRSLCAARQGQRGERERKRGRKDQQGRSVVLLKAWWGQQWNTFEDHGSSSVVQADAVGPGCVCREVESVCTVSDLLPDTQYYFDVFVVDRVNRTSAAYTGTFTHTHAEARGVATPLKDGQVQWVTLSSGSGSEQRFSFRPRGGQQNGLLTLHSCNSTKAKVAVSSRGRLLSSQEVGDQLAQIWLHGSPSYLIQLDAVASAKDDPEKSKVCVKMQASSAFHRRGAPVVPVTLQLKSFNKLRSCSSVTLAWMGTEERSLYCLYQRRVPDHPGRPDHTDRCLDPESRPAAERILCKYFQELDPRRAVTTAAVGGLRPGSLYQFDVYLMRRWGLPIKYHSKTVRTRREC